MEYKLKIRQEINKYSKNLENLICDIEKLFESLKAVLTIIISKVWKTCEIKSRKVTKKYIM